MAATVHSYEFSFSTPDPGGGDSIPTAFTVGGLAEDVVQGMRYGLTQVNTITDVAVVQILFDRADLAPVDPVP